MKDGLYAVEFRTPLGSGTGVVTLINGNLSGGDSLMYYTGAYSLEGDAFTAKVKTGRHAHIPGFSSVFGRDQVTINLKGNVTGDTMTATGSSADAPGVTFSAKLTLIAVGG
ncbi:MAG TPA: GrlR family regulatory protein [Bradyrhizobium sp.]|nr:GrlR family regulatory protein [Bradyrhizobium sp.]